MVTALETLGANLKIGPDRLSSLALVETAASGIRKSIEFQGFIRAAEEDPNAYPKELLAYLGKSGSLGLEIPQAYGGAEMPTLDATWFVTDMAEEHAGTMLQMYVVNESLTAWPISQFGTEEQKQNYLPRMARGELAACLGHTEPDTGSDAKNIQLSAKWDEQEQGWFLNGTKQFITGASGAGLAIVSARTGAPDSRGEGISTFILELDKVQGFSIDKIHNKIGQAGSPLCQPRFDNVFAPKSSLLGVENQGWGNVGKTFEHSRIYIAGQGLGVARRAYKEALKYGMQRMQFGKFLVEHEDYKNHLDVLGRQIDILEHLVARAALKEEEQKLTNENIYPGAWAALAKWVAGETAIRWAGDAMLMHGGSGYIEPEDPDEKAKFVIGRVFRDSPVIRIYEGTAHMLRKIMRNHGMPIALLRLLDPPNGQLYTTGELLPASMISAAVDAWEPEPIKK